MLQIQHISKQYVTGELVQKALDDVSLNLRDNEFVAILGPSGSGKTTLLNVIGGLDRYDSGDLVINGVSTRRYKDHDWDSYRNHTVGFVFQSYNLIPHQSVLANVELALAISGVSHAERRRRAKAALEKVGLGDQLHKRPNQMSGGQMQRVAIARALVNNPDILLADEPTGALDSETSIQVMELLKEVAKDRLVVMVTHNPELAETYATRIVRLRDGRITDDSMPLEGSGEGEHRSMGKASMSFFTSLGLSFNNLRTKKGRTLLTAFAGSIGIIGIALILALSNGIQTYIDRVQEDTLSSYPITIEAEHVDMSSMVESMMGVQEKREGEQHELDAVYSNTIMYDMLQSLASTEIQTNNLRDFKKFLDSGENGLAEHISAVQYGYHINTAFYAKDSAGTIFKSDVADLLQTCMSSLYGGDYSNYFSQFGAAYSGMDVWEEMLPPQEQKDGQLVNDLLYEQYDLIYGSWPQNYDEAVLIVNDRNEISDLVIYCMGLGSQDAVMEAMQAMMKGGEMETYQESWAYEDVCALRFKAVLPAERYQYDAASGTYTDVSGTETGRDFLYNADSVGTMVKIVGILRPNEDAVSSMMSGAIGYTAALTEHLLEKANEAEVLQKQLEDPETDVLTGLPFWTEDYSVSEEQKCADVTEHLRSLPLSERAAVYTALMSRPTAEYLDTVVAQQMSTLDRAYVEQVAAVSYAEQMGVDEETVRAYIAQMDDETLFGLVEQTLREQITQQYAAGVQQQLGAMTAEQLAGALEAALAGGMPPQIQPLTQEQYDWLYDEYMPETVSHGTFEGNCRLLGQVDRESPRSIRIYASTFADKDAIADAIAAYNAGVAEEDQIDYTDYVALLMSSITTIINAISYVLIAFVAISLVVSSIMIGIITHISVLERTKEIGILRAIGASKKDIARVFNAETLIIGFCAGAIGIGATLLLILPINAIVQKLTGIASLRAILPTAGGVALVIISVVLTLVAGLIPARAAARKDPVIALRTE